jgi:protein SCO1
MALLKSMPDNATNAAAPVQAGEERLFQIILLALAAVIGLGFWMAATALSRREEVRGISPDKPRELAAFSLTNCTGAAVTRGNLDGKILAVSFLFTGCGTTCPEVSQRMAEIQQLTTNQPDVQLVSFTVDPRTDTTTVLSKWAARYGADTNRWFLLTGNKAALQALVGTSFLYRDVGDPFNSMPCNFIGTERIAVVDRHGRVRMYFNGLRHESAAAVAAEIEKLRREK